MDSKHLLSRLILLAAAAVLLSACGIKGNLVKPSDIPAYEEKQKRKQSEF